MSEAQELTETQNLQRNGANLIEVWEFLLNSPPHRAAYEQHYPQGKIASLVISPRDRCAS